MARMRYLSWALVLMVANLGSAVAATVAPIHAAVNGVVLRDLPSATDTRRIGKLLRGERAVIQDSVPYWYRIALPSGLEGYVSKRWVHVVPDPSIAAPGVPFELHVVDVGVGDGFLLDVGDQEILVDGGMYGAPFIDYFTQHSLIKSPIELAIVTHADADHWKGMQALLGLPTPTPRYSVSEFWEPGYRRGCSALESYDTFIRQMKQIVPAAGFRRPLETVHIPSASSAVLTPIDLPSIPGVRLTLLHSEQAPEGQDCAYQINNASIVLGVEVGGVVMLWTGDTNGKLRDDPASVAPTDVEEKLLAIERQHPGILKADILKVAHHGSETASTDAFIAAVKPRFALISASTNHHLPRHEVVERYEAAGAIVLRTDVSRKKSDDPLLCIGSGGGDFDCNFLDQFDF